MSSVHPLTGRRRNNWSTRQHAAFVAAYTSGGLPAARNACPGISDMALMTRAGRYRLRSPLTFSGPAWPVADVTRLTLAWPRGGLPAACAALPHRTRHAVAKMATRLGVSGSSERWCHWSEDEHAVLHRHYHAGGAIACRPHLPGRTTASIHSQAKKLGLHCRATGRKPKVATHA